MNCLGLALAAALLVSGPALAAPATLSTGAYENTLLLGYDPATGLVTGYFNMVYPGPPEVSCAFYLKGKLAGAKAAIDTYYPDDPTGDLIKGTLSLQGRRTVGIALVDDHGGCGNVWQFADKTAPLSTFALDSAHAWTSVRVVKADKAFFYPTAGAATHGKAYIVIGDGVGVKAAQPGWDEVDFTGGKRVISGWVRDEDLFPG